MHIIANPYRQSVAYDRIWCNPLHTYESMLIFTFKQKNACKTSVRDLPVGMRNETGWDEQGGQGAVMNSSCKRSNR
jgi:hypothetical protein